MVAGLQRPFFYNFVICLNNHFGHFDKWYFVMKLKVNEGKGSYAHDPLI